VQVWPQNLKNQQWGETMDNRRSCAGINLGKFSVPLWCMANVLGCHKGHIMAIIRNCEAVEGVDWCMKRPDFSDGKWHALIGRSCVHLSEDLAAFVARQMGQWDAEGCNAKVREAMDGTRKTYEDKLAERRERYSKREQESSKIK
jgi:hypothetical protein